MPKSKNKNKNLDILQKTTLNVEISTDTEDVTQTEPVELENAVEPSELETSGEVAEVETSDEVETTDDVAEVEVSDEVETTDDFAEVEASDEVETTDDVAEIEASDEVSETDNSEPVTIADLKTNVDASPIPDIYDQLDVAASTEVPSTVNIQAIPTEQNVWLERLKPVMVLCAICMVAALLLGVTNELTAPIIAANSSNAEKQSMQELIAQADDFVAIELTTEQLENADTAYTAVQGEETVGYIVTTSSKGYGGDVPLVVAFDAEGALSGISIGDNGETPGIGDRIYDEAYLSQFIGITVQLPETEYDGLSGATYSSGAVYESVNKALSVILAITGEEE